MMLHSVLFFLPLWNHSLPKTILFLNSQYTLSNDLTTFFFTVFSLYICRYYTIFKFFFLYQIPPRLAMVAAPKDVRPVHPWATSSQCELASDSHHWHPCPYRNKVEEWSGSGTADVATRTEWGEPPYNYTIIYVPSSLQLRDVRR